MRRGLARRFAKELKSAGLLGALEMNDEQAARIREAQLDSVTEHSNVINLAGMLNVMVLVLSFWQSDVGNLVFCWGGLMCFVHGYMAFASYRAKRKRVGEDPDKFVDDHLAAFVRGASIVGVLWGLIALIIIPLSDTIGLTASGMLLVSTMFGGVLLIGRVPNAAMGMVLPIALGVLAGLQFQQDPRNTLLSVMTMAYFGVLFFAARASFSQFAQQHISRLDMQEQTEVISLLLKDFEENSSDWLWQTDECGVIVARDVETSTDDDSETRMPQGGALLDLFERCEGKEQLDDAVRSRRPFRDLNLKREGKAGLEWWSFTGKPVFHGGQFQGYRGVASDITQAKVFEDRIAYLAHYDALTGLPNRSAFSERLQRLALEVRDDAEFALVWLNLDNFKWINDSKGHHAGDELLRCVARRIRGEVGTEGLSARISGDEFVLVVPLVSGARLDERLNALSERFSEPYQLWNTQLQCRASMGVKMLPQGAIDVEAVLKHADTALSEAKSREKGTWVLFDQALEARARSIGEMEIELGNAIERDELRIFFQPLISAKTEKVVAVETLLRWQHPTKGLLTPDKFIEFAEDKGMISRIGEWVIREALLQARRIPEHVRVAINISPLQIHSDSLLTTIVNALASNGIAANRLELEITESVLIADPAYTLERLNKLKDLGLRIALDDFGTGFSSLSYLRQFAFDKIKIDKSFTQDLETDEDSRAITQATLQLAKALRMRCTGEGVETPRQADFLRENGCDELQGYMISRPLPLENLGHLIDLSPANETGRADIRPLRTSKQDTVTASALKSSTG